MADKLNPFEELWKGDWFSLIWIIRFFRLIGVKKIIRYVRSRGSAGLFFRLHNEVLHEMRTLGISMKKWIHNERETTQQAGKICNECNDLMCDLLELNNNKLHCCLKVFKKVQVDHNDEDYVETWIRSVPSDGRSDSDDIHFLVKENTVWSALLGRSDGNFRWCNPFICFSCNDLHAHREQFKNSRTDWESYYRSALVFPLRHIYFQAGKKYIAIIGFLAFDSPEKNTFPGLPDIFMHRETGKDVSDYNSKLQTSTIFHLGAIMADMLSMFLRPVFEKYSKREENRYEL
jgi:hypothetical protein